MVAPFDLLGSASFLVEDRVATATAIQRALGVPVPKPHWILDTPGRGLTVTFLRVGSSVAASPTPIEIVQIDDRPPGDGAADRDPHAELPVLPAIARAQGARPTKVHATDIAVEDIEELIERCRRSARRHWVKEDQLGVRRVWIGFDPDATTESAEYRPDGDGGLHFEFLPTTALRLPPAAFDQLPPPALAGQGAMLRLAYRTYVVDHLDRVLDDIAASFGWQPDAPVQTASNGSRRAVLGFRLPTSPRLMLVEPHDSGDEMDALHRWGPGAWSISIGVDGLDAKMEDLHRRGVRFRELPTGFSRGPSRILRVDPSQTPGCLFDLVDASEAE